jgi:hypothetical protein
LRRSLPAVVAAVGALLCVPAAASASHTAYVDQVATTTPGCEVKGLWLVPYNDPAGTLAGVFRYTVTALDAGGVDMSAACEAEVTSVDAPGNAVLLDWRATPGAAGYRVYRGAFAGPMQAIAATPVCRASGRCFTVDRGNPAAGAATPTFASPLTQAGAPADLKLVQRVDYGGSDADSSATNTSDDPFPAAISTDLLHFPAGLVPNPGAAPRCPLFGESSLLGSKDAFGGDDPNEDTCPRSTQVGTVKTTSRVPAGPGTTRIQISVGDVYNGETKGSEAGRLFVVIRPACSDDQAPPLAPGSDTCKAALGQPAGSPKDFEVEREFLASVATIVDRGNGVVGVDAHTVKAEDDSPLAPKIGVLVPGPGGALTHAPASQSPDVQVRQLTQNLFGRAESGTPFLVLPTSCALKTLTADVTTHQDQSVSTGSNSLAATGCANVPFGPAIEALLGGAGQNAPDAHPALSVTVRQSPGEAATRSATVNLPASIGPALAGLANVCSKADFAKGACPPITQKGEATATTPLLPITLSGPVHLVDNAPDFPQLGVTLTGGPLPPVRFLGNIALGPTGTGIVNSFPQLPEVPLTTFTLKFAPGPGSLLQNVKDICTGAGDITAGFEGYNGKQSSASSAVTVDQAGCPSVPPAKPRPQASASMTKVKTGKPTLTLTVRSGAPAQALMSLRIGVPKGLELDRKAFKRGLRVNARAINTSRVTKGIRLVKGRLSLSTLPAGASSVVVTLSKGALTANKKVRKRGRKQTLRFPVRVADATNEAVNLRPRVRPRS